MNIEVLEQIGLTKSEIKVYLALLELGSSSTGKIIDKSKASSSKIYEILDRLIQKGLVSFIIKSGVKYFEAAPVERIMDYMEEKEKTFNKQKQELKEILPSLKAKQTISKFKSGATIYKGLKGIGTAYYDALKLMKPGETILVMGAPSRSEELNNFFTKYTEESGRRKVKLKVIFNEEARGELQTKKAHLPTAEVKYSPEITPSETAIFNDRVLIFPESKEPILIAIDNKEVAESFRVQFEKWWNQEAHTMEGFEGLETGFNDALKLMKPGEEILVMGIPPRSKKVTNFFTQFNNERAEKKVKLRAIINDAAKKDSEKFAENKTLSQIKYTPEITPAAINIFKDRVLITPSSKKPMVITINNKEVAESFRVQFEKWWNQEARTITGFKEVTGRFSSAMREMKPGEEYYVLNATYGKGGQRLLDYFLDYHTERIKRGVKIKLIGVKKAHHLIKKEFTKTGDPKMKLSELRTMKKESKQPMQINLYPGNKVLLFLWGEEMTCFEIESKILYDNFKDQFDAEWKKGLK